MKFDVALVLGTGIKQNGTLPDSCLANVNYAIELYQNKEVGKIIFSGKWAWNCKYQPPFTEALAMKRYALSKGIPDTDILIQDNAVTTVANLCDVKNNILIPRNYKSLIFISANDILKVRNQYNLEMVLGPDYTYEIRLSNFSYPPEITAELSAKESQKIIDCQKFFHGITPGDHELIAQLAQVDLDKNYLKKQS
ncbi:MAG TPA: YdcF family protein, partial [Candidatus Woesebacteria bacterium]|nr:YdcF family protein [Candidatus Woesebacteria bacterium]HPJ16752.1 YdcF family protein [Candidatus Woesebacteria bacterium]